MAEILDQLNGAKMAARKWLNALAFRIDQNREGNET